MHTIPMIHSDVLAPFFRRDGGEWDRLPEELWNVGLPASLVEGEALAIPLVPALRLVSNLAKRLDTRDFGLQVGSATSLRSLAELGKVIAGSTTLLSAIHAVIGVLPKLTTARRVWLDVTATTARMSQTVPNCSVLGAEQAEQYSLMLFINLVREVAGKSWSPSHITVSQPTFDLIGKYPALLGDSVVVVGEFTSFTFDACMLNWKLPGHQEPEDPSSKKFMKDSAIELPVDANGSLRATLESNLRAGLVGLEHLTQALGVSPRTLQRQLAMNGLTYNRLLSQTRFQIAQELLAEPDVRIAEIAFALGYEDAANFTRAFRRWTGIAPIEYRRIAAVV